MECLATAILASSITILKVFHLPRNHHVPRILQKLGVSLKSKKKVFVKKVKPDETEKGQDMGQNKCRNSIIGDDGDHPWQTLAKSMDFYVFNFSILFVCVATACLIGMLMT